MRRIDSEVLRRQLKLYFIMGSINCSSPAAEVLSKAIAGGVTMFQFREKGRGALAGQARLELAGQLQQICRAYAVPFIVNDDVELAIALNADGLHVGQEDAPAAAIRQRLGDHKIVGVSAHSLNEARQAIKDGADYLGVGPIYPTASKEDARAVQGTMVIEELRSHGIDIPLVGIGGITAANAAPVTRVGADGLSVISAIAGAGDIREAARAFVRVI